MDIVERAKLTVRELVEESELKLTDAQFLMMSYIVGKHMLEFHLERQNEEFLSVSELYKKTIPHIIPLGATAVTTCSLTRSLPASCQVVNCACKLKEG